MTRQIGTAISNYEQYTSAPLQRLRSIHFCVFHQGEVHRVRGVRVSEWSINQHPLDNCFGITQCATWIRRVVAHDVVGQRYRGGIAKVDYREAMHERCSFDVLCQTVDQALTLADSVSVTIVAWVLPHAARLIQKYRDV